MIEEVNCKNIIINYDISWQMGGGNVELVNWQFYLNLK